MNKQELIEKHKNKYPIISMDIKEFRYFLELWEDVKQLDEPQKPVVPQFVADYIKYAIENDWDFQDLFKCIEDEEDEELLRWVYHERNQETLAAAWINGYTVEKEKRYRVKLKGIKSDKCYLNCVGNARNWIIGNDEGYAHIIVEHTRKELEDSGFGEVFDSPLFEVEEVAE